ncbi:MAG: isoprenylcysteine carboxylmethyltransferase family protein [Chthoniobacterales bacterium]|nr:isoprenylcysteine carboxylmethyltransferase family protein [Chthoniobacterales bacterium]
MNLPSFTTLSALLLASEVALALAKRSKVPGGGTDRSTLPLLWLVICASIFAGFFLRAALPQGSLPHPKLFYVAGLILLILGLTIRWIAIIHLGRFFTVNVAIAQDHKLITTGPYRYVRHPSYTGTLLIFLGFGLCMLNIYSLAALFLPIAAAFLWRMHVEETALAEAFGDRYRDYTARTRRVIPFLY